MGFGPYFEIPHRIGDRDGLVIMRPPEEGDAAEMARLMQDFTVQQFLFLQGGMTEKDEEDFFERCRTSRDHVLWAISVQYDDQPEELVGVTSLHRQRSKRYSTGINLANRDFWGKGIAKLTHQFRTWYAFCELGAYALNSSYIADNPYSGKALASVGYVEYGRNWKSHFTNGRWCDEVMLVCYNPLTTSLLWPDDDIPDPVRNALPLTEAAFAKTRAKLNLR